MDESSPSLPTRLGLRAAKDVGQQLAGRTTRPGVVVGPHDEEVDILLDRTGQCAAERPLERLQQRATEAGSLSPVDDPLRVDDLDDVRHGTAQRVSRRSEDRPDPVVITGSTGGRIDVGYAQTGEIDTERPLTRDRLQTTTRTTVTQPVVVGDHGHLGMRERAGRRRGTMTDPAIQHQSQADAVLDAVTECDLTNRRVERHQTGVLVADPDSRSR